METFIGQVSSDVERREDRWHFSLFNNEKNEEINCVSSVRFETENQTRKLNLKPQGFAEVAGGRRSGEFVFDNLRLQKEPKSK
jgi:hypothetical protein